jgi:hypothetical protein
MKATIKFNSSRTDVIIENDDDFLTIPGLAPNPFNLTKAQAVRHLDSLFVNYVTANALPELIAKAPDFRTLIDENIRDEFPPSATLKGLRRGNRCKYSTIPHKRLAIGKNCKILFRVSDLDDWFAIHFLPAIAKKLH